MKAVKTQTSVCLHYITLWKVAVLYAQYCTHYNHYNCTTIPPPCTSAARKVASFRAEVLTATVFRVRALCTLVEFNCPEEGSKTLLRTVR